MTIYRHVASGITPGEVWECTFHTEGSLDLTSAQTAWVAAWTAFWQGAAAPLDNVDQLISDDVSTTGLTTAALDPVTHKQVSKAEDDVDLPGTATTEMLPFQNAVGITWLSAVANRSGRGRMYLPPYSTATVAAGRLATADVTITLTAGKNIFQTMNFAGATPIIYSRTTHLGTPISAIRCGNVFNTQTRRRDKLQPVYATAAF